MNTIRIWFDVTLWMEVVKSVRDTLSTVDAANAADYAANADAFLQELDELHAYVSPRLRAYRTSSACSSPRTMRSTISAAPTASMCAACRASALRPKRARPMCSDWPTIVEHEIPAIFIESSVPIRNVEALQAAVAAKGHQVEIGGELFSDAMGDPGTPEGTYVGMVRHNVDTIVAALLGE
ncbi:MAG: zinc ABC transporter substrate-binding protein [Caldilineaceae bacterium]